jgi:aryl-alcohol dehydrogenase-like predicted oxidoreductase
MPEPLKVEQASFGPDYRFPRLLRGGWQLAGGHGEVDHARAIGDMFAFVDAGVTAFDCADIYTGVEALIGAFRAQLARERGEAALRQLKVHTKFVPDWDQLGSIRREDVDRIIDRSLKRLRTERLDLVQFHWWNYESDGMIDTALMLKDLARAGKIDRIGGTNFSSLQTAAMMAAGVPLVSMQTQYSLLDARPEHGLTDLCATTGLQLLCYGTVAGGFLSERWLGQPEPREPFANRSLVKYKLIIDDFGGWELFQRLLQVLAGIARKHGVGLTAVATRHVLDQPHVAGVIVGARYADHLDANLAVFRFALDAADKAAIAAVLVERTGPLGDTYTLERDREGRHGRIMKYNLNKD